MHIRQAVVPVVSSRMAFRKPTQSALALQNVLHPPPQEDNRHALRQARHPRRRRRFTRGQIHHRCQCARARRPRALLAPPEQRVGKRDGRRPRKQAADAARGRGAALAPDLADGGRGGGEVEREGRGETVGELAAQDEVVDGEGREDGVVECLDEHVVGLGIHDVRERSLKELRYRRGLFDRALPQRFLPVALDHDLLKHVQVHFWPRLMK
mmetsp:Transcript_657/g.1896  ORF Transcript_657/g.1896 Transcript_657/m.1896 type:complete len:211 (-) Transcript_657:335-967(-)